MTLKIWTAVLWASALCIQF